MARDEDVDDDCGEQDHRRLPIWRVRVIGVATLANGLVGNVGAVYLLMTSPMWITALATAAAIVLAALGIALSGDRQIRP